MSESRKNILAPFEENRDLIESRLKEGIEKHRQGAAEIKLLDHAGKSVSGAHVTIEQKSHEFKYGANIFMLDEFENEEKNRLYRKYFKDVCNIATLPFYWKDLEPEQGKPRFSKDSPRVYRRPAIDLCMEYCEENHIEPKEHCLFYETWMADWAPADNVSALKKAYEKRISEIAERYSGKIRSWEVTNETLYFWEKTSALYLAPDLIEWAFACAEKYLPNNHLVINEAHCNIWNVFNENRSAYYMQIERALAKGARIDAVGMQFHMFYPREQEKEETKLFYDPRHLYRVMERYDDFKKPIQLTEITIPAYSKNEEDEAIQAELIRNLYSIWFSHGSVEAIQYWNLVDGYAAFAPLGDMTAGENYYHGGLFRFDMTPKPAYYTIRDLFEKEWHTHKELTSDGDGLAAFKGFYGDYEVTVQTPSGEKKENISVQKGKENSFILNV